MEGSKHIVEFDFVVAEVIAFKDNRRANQLSMRGDCVDFILIVVSNNRENRAILVNSQG